MDTLTRPADPTGGGNDRNAVRRLNEHFTAEADRFYREAKDLDDADLPVAAELSRRRADHLKAIVRNYGQSAGTVRR